MLGISLPQEILLKIDKDRGRIPRATFLVKLIELAYNTNTIKPVELYNERKNVLSDESFGELASDKTSIAIRSKASWI